MLRYNNNWGLEQWGRVLGEIEKSLFLAKHLSFIYLCEQ